MYQLGLILLKSLESYRDEGITSIQDESLELREDAVANVLPEDDFQRAISDACDFIIRLKKSGLNIILPEDQNDCQDRFELLVNLLSTEKGIAGDKTDWLTDEMVKCAAFTIGARICSMQHHLAKKAARDRMKKMISAYQ
ncbi:hypothetical protein [Brucella anthropi]|uniref:hypothetical protein n=1 Tax=Brucella anthropi TaxID=529 RepID=UPI003D975711